MRRRLTRLTVALGAALLALAPAGTAGENSPFAKGDFSAASIDRIEFDARNRADTPGDAAKGSFKAKNFLGDQDFEGSVKCLRVDGKDAFFSGRITKSSNPAFEDRSSFFGNVSDSGKRKGKGDEFSNLLVVSPATPTCSAPTSGGVPIEKGNIVVRDAK